MVLQRSLRLTGAAVLVAVALAGCSSTNPPAVGNDPMAPGTYPRNVALNGLNDWVVCGTPIVTQVTEMKPMSVVQPVRNISDSSIKVQYRFEFYDAMRRPVTRDKEWQFAKLDPKIEMNLEGAALDTDAVDWRLIIRSAR